MKGEKIGYHDGVVFHTLGERHGFTIIKKSPKDSPYYVVGKDVKKNILLVSQFPDVQRRGIFDVGRLEKSTILCFVGIKDTNWISKVPKSDKNYTCQIRYHGEFFSCRIRNINKNTASIFFEERASGLPARPLVAAGQSCVIYDGDVCLGGGVVV